MSRKQELYNQRSRKLGKIKMKSLITNYGLKKNNWAWQLMPVRDYNYLRQRTVGSRFKGWVKS
jgi:hypothetical protein